MIGFYRRNGIGPRRRTNNHKESFEQREPRLKRYLAGLQRRVGKSKDSRNKTAWGKYPAEKRANSDQVPFTFGENAKTTLERKGRERVQIFTGRGDSDLKRMGTLQPLFVNLPPDRWKEQPPLTIIFPGKPGNSYYDKERPKYGALSRDDSFRGAFLRATPQVVGPVCPTP